MTIRNTGRRGLFGLLLGAPAAVVAVAAKGDQPSDDRLQIDAIVEAVESKMAARIVKNRWTSYGFIGESGPEAIVPLRRGSSGRLSTAIERTYGLQPVGRS